MKPKVAQENGAVGCLIYSDPREDGFSRATSIRSALSSGHGVQRGSVMDMALYPGDPLIARMGFGKRRPAIAALERSKDADEDSGAADLLADDASRWLQQLGGPVAPEGWRGALPITYHVGPGPATVHLKLDFDWTSKTAL